MKDAISDDEFRYFKTVSHRIQEDFEDEEEKELFLANVFQEMKGREMDISSNKVLSRLVEDCLKMSVELKQVEHHLQIMNAFSENIRLVCKNQCACHVVETLLHGVPDIYENNSNKTNDDSPENDVKEIEEWVSKLTKFVVNNMEEFMTDTYASHVIRTLLQLLGKKIISNDPKKNHFSKKAASKFVIRSPHLLPTSFPDLLELFHERMIAASDRIPEWSCDELVSPVIQTLLHVIHHTNPSNSKKLMKRIVKITTSKTEAGKNTGLLTNDKGSHLMETMLKLCTSKLRKTWYEKYIKWQLKDLCFHSIGNFVIQNFLRSIEDKELFATVFDDMSQIFKDILERKHFGILVAMSDTCIRLSACQGVFIQELIKVFNCHENPDQQKMFIVSLCKFQPSPQNTDLDKITLQGSLILQNILKFNKPIKIVQSLIDMDAVTLTKLANDKSGSHVIDSFFTSSTIGEKSRNKFVDSFKGQFVALACDKHGSRSIESIWNSSPLKLKSNIAAEMILKDSELQSNTFGRLIYHKFALLHFKRYPQKWREVQTEHMNKKRMLSDILKDDKSSKKHKKEVEEEESL